MSDLVLNEPRTLGEMGRFDVGRFQAELETAYAVAHSKGRDVDQCWIGLKRQLEKFDVARIALYEKPVGDGQVAVGFSIRFIEMVVFIWRHLRIRTTISYDDATKLIFNVSALDLLTNSLIEVERVVPKVVERKNAKGRNVKGRRTNSRGEEVFLVEATGDEVQLKVAAEQSKQFRDCVQRLLPRDLLDECRAVVRKTLTAKAAKDPEKTKKELLDSFDRLGISPGELKAYVGRPLEGLTPSDMAELRVLYRGLKDREFVWGDVMAMKAQEAEGEPPPDMEPTKEQAKARKLRDRLMKATKPEEKEEEADG